MENELNPGQDFYIDELGRLVYTEFFLRKRGYCCGMGCRHCPYGFIAENGGESQHENHSESGLRTFELPPHLNAGLSSDEEE